jgi:hypothetical protein
MFPARQCFYKDAWDAHGVRAALRAEHDTDLQRYHRVPPSSNPPWKVLENIKSSEKSCIRKL